MFRIFRLLLPYLMMIATLGGAENAAAQSQGYALSFRNNQCATIPSDSSLNPSRLTVECWVKFDTDEWSTFVAKGFYMHGAYSLLLLKDDNDEQRKIHFYLEYTPPSLVEVNSGNLAISKDQWYHVAGTYDGNIMSLYLNGNLVSSQRVGSVPVGNENPLIFGGFPCEVDEVRIWSVARTPEEIRSNMYRELDGTQGLVSAWHCNEGSGQVISDATDSNNGYLGSAAEIDDRDPQWTPSTAPVTKCLLVISPNGGEDWQLGTPRTIRWNGGDSSAIDIDYSPDAGATWKPIATRVDASAGSDTWIIPQDASPLSLIRITDSTHPEISDISDQVFNVTPAYVRLLSPNGGEKWETQTMHTISWKSTGVEKISIDYSTDDGINWMPIADGVSAASDSLVWSAPFIHSETCRIRIRSADPPLVSISGNPFAIVQSSIVLHSPQNGDILESGSVEYITWKATPGVDSVRVEYSADDGNSWNLLGTADADSSTYRWNIPSTAVSQAHVRVSWIAHPEVFADTGAFSIVSTAPWATYSNGNSVVNIGVQGDYVWCGTSGGLERWDKRDMSCRKFTAADGLNDGDRYTSVSVSPDGGVCCSTGSGIYWLYGERFEQIYQNLDMPVSHPYVAYFKALSRDSMIMFFYYMYEINVYIYTKGKDSKKPTVSTYLTLDEFTWNCYAMVSNGSSIMGIFLGNHDGLLYYDADKNPTRFTTADGLPDNKITSLTLAPNGNIWCGTPKGLCRYDGNRWRTFLESDGVNFTDFSSSAFGPDGSVWFVTPSGLCSFNGKSWKTWTMPPGIADAKISSVAVAPDRTVWLGTSYGLTRFIPDKLGSIEERNVKPSPLAIAGNYPNPFNPSTTISFTLPAPGKASLVVYDITGRKVRVLASGKLPAGKNTAVWDGKDDSGRLVSSGVYVSRVTMGKYTAVGKMLLMK